MRGLGKRDATEVKCIGTWGTLSLHKFYAMRQALFTQNLKTDVPIKDEKRKCYFSTGLSVKSRHFK